MLVRSLTKNGKYKWGERSKFREVLTIFEINEKALILGDNGNSKGGRSEGSGRVRRRDWELACYKANLRDYASLSSLNLSCSLSCWVLWSLD